MSTSARTASTTAPASSRGSAATRPPQARRCSGSSDHSSASTSRPRSSTWSCRTRSRSCARATTSCRRQRSRRVLRPADRLLRLRRARRPSGRNPVDVVIMTWPWGAYLGEEALRKASAQGLDLEARRAEHDTARRQGDRHLPQLDARGDRGAAAPATRRRSSSPRTATSPTAPARTSSSSRTASSRRPTSPPRSCPASPGRP